MKYQNSRILSELEEQRCLYENSKMDSYELNQRLDSIVNVLEDVLSKIWSPDAILEQLTSFREDIKEQFTGVFRSLSSHAELANEADKWSHIMDEIKSLCQAINERVHDGQETLRLQGLYEEANNKLQAVEKLNQSTEAQLKETRESRQSLVNSNNQHKQQITSLETQLEGLREQLRHANHSEASEVSRLQQLVSENEKSLQELRARLETGLEQLRIKEAALEEAESDRQKLTMTLHSVNKRAGTEEMEKTNLLESRNDAERRLADSEKAQAKSERELQKAKVRIQDLSARSPDDLPKLMKENIKRVEDVVRLYMSVQQGIDVLKQTSDRDTSRAEVSQLQETSQVLERKSAAIKTLIDNCAKSVEVGDKTPRISPSQEPRNRAAELSHDDDSLIPASLSLEEQQARHRVTLKSPTDEMSAPPLTASQERLRRRTMLPLKSSIKTAGRVAVEPNSTVPVADRPAVSSSADFHGAQNNLVMPVHNSFNRPVTGAIVPAGKDESELRRAALKRPPSRPDAVTNFQDDDDNDGGHKSKQQRASPPPKQARKSSESQPVRQKLGRSLIPSTPGEMEWEYGSELDEEDTQKPSVGAVQLSQQSRGGPLRRQPSRLKTYGSHEA